MSGEPLGFIKNESKNLSGVDARVINADQVIAEESLVVSDALGTLDYLGSGAVTQITSNATAVISNTSTGAITMFAVVAATTGFSFTVTNSVATPTSLINAFLISGGVTATFIPLTVGVTARAAGSFVISVGNNSAAATAAAAVIGFVINNVE